MSGLRFPEERQKSQWTLGHEVCEHHISFELSLAGLFVPKSHVLQIALYPALSLAIHPILVFFPNDVLLPACLRLPVAALEKTWWEKAVHLVYTLETK